MTPESLPEPIAVALSFTRVLDDLGVAYVIGGSLAVDVFVAGNDPLNRERLDFRERVRAWSEPDAWLFIDTPEHSILRKLEWYRRGGEMSERQRAFEEAEA